MEAKMNEFQFALAKKCDALGDAFEELLKDHRRQYNEVLDQVLALAKEMADLGDDEGSKKLVKIVEQHPWSDYYREFGDLQERIEKLRCAIRCAFSDEAAVDVVRVEFMDLQDKAYRAFRADRRRYSEYKAVDDLYRLSLRVSDWIPGKATAAKIQRLLDEAKQHPIVNE